jgi:hypothetical protein
LLKWWAHGFSQLTESVRARNPDRIFYQPMGFVPEDVFPFDIFLRFSVCHFFYLIKVWAYVKNSNKL